MVSRNLFATAFIIWVSAVTVRSADISITINPIYAREFVNKYSIVCQYPTPSGNSSTTGVLRVTHLTNNEDIYSFDFGFNQEIISSTMKDRSVVNLNQTTATLTLQVNVARATDSGSYNCSLIDSTSAYYATTTAPLNVTGCANGSLVRDLSQCSSVNNGDSCSIVCTSIDANGMVSLSRSYDGSNPLTSNLSQINYTIDSVRDADYGEYYCYIKTVACTSMSEASITPIAVTTSPAKDTNTTSCVGGCKKRIPGWGIALIVIACVVVVVLIILIILFVLHKKGVFHQKVCCHQSDGEVQPTGRDQSRSVANDNFAMTKSKTNENSKGKKDNKADNNTQAVNFPDVKTRKNVLPPLATTGLNHNNTNDDVPTSGRALPKRRTSTDDHHSPEDRHRNSLGRRRSIEDGSPERGSKLPPLRGQTRDYDDDDEERDRF